MKKMDARFRNIAERLINEILTSRQNVSIAIAWFTNESIFDTILKKLDGGITVELILINDHINNRANGLDLSKFIDCGGKLYFSNGQYLMHNKFAIIDSERLVTGSYNWTYNAEFRNNENIVFLSDLSVIEKFEAEFTAIKRNSTEQKDIIAPPPEYSQEINVKAYLKNDLISKSQQAEQEGKLKKSLEAIDEAIKIDQQDDELKKKLEELKRKISPEYHHHVEDGQFSFDFTTKRLLGKEGEIIKVSEPFDDGYENEIYILYVDEYYVECIGNVERSFPKDNLEHHEIKDQTIEVYESFE